MRGVADQLATLRPRGSGAAVESLATLEDRLEALEPGPERGAVGAVPTRLGGTSASAGPPPDSLSGASAALAAVMNLLQGADVRPTTVQLNAIAAARAAVAKAMARWAAVKTVYVVAVNAALKAAGLPSLAHDAPRTTRPRNRPPAPQPAQPAPASDRAEALAEAARKGDAAAVKKLLDEGVDVNTKFRYGATACRSPAIADTSTSSKLLLDRGADVNVKDTFYNATPLTWAVSPAMGRKPQHADDRPAAAGARRAGKDRR